MALGRLGHWGRAGASHHLGNGQLRLLGQFHRAAGSGYTVGQYLTATGTLDTPAAKIVFKVTSVSSGGVTGLQIISGGGFTTVPTNPVATARITGTGGTGCTVNLNYAPGLQLVPDLSTALDNTSVFAIVESMVTLTDSGGTNTVRAGLYLPDPASWQTAVQIPTTTKTDTGITVAVNHSPTGNPGFTGSGLSSVAADYKWSAGSPCQDAGTNDNAPSTDYFGTSRPQGSAIDLGFFEIIAGGFAPVSSGLVDGGLVL